MEYEQVFASQIWRLNVFYNGDKLFGAGQGVPLCYHNHSLACPNPTVLSTTSCSLYIYRLTLNKNINCFNLTLATYLCVTTRTTDPLPRFISLGAGRRTKGKGHLIFIRPLLQFPQWKAEKQILNARLLLRGFWLVAITFDFPPLYPLYPTTPSRSTTTPRAPIVYLQWRIQWASLRSVPGECRRHTFDHRIEQQQQQPEPPPLYGGFYWLKRIVYQHGYIGEEF